eukprot:gb/GFBE01024151.1/.p1 GENE.gb/GFBE01024151.1/~~gb/GFBE01024151.1/.p1  ORF type:complete len:526 (+),score=178.41 gb/GFBE01024151.1/:1-1578(+)
MDAEKGKGDSKKGGQQGGSLGNVVKLVVKTFLEQRHYRQLHRILSEQWQSAHSLTAVVRLMEAHGMKVTPEEEQRLAGLPEDRMIDALVMRMPQQSREQYEHFFLQLSFIASTTTRLRSALETGNAEVVEEALESAENVGVLPYLMRMAVSQAGQEVKLMEELHDKWLVDTDGKMAPLLQAQATSMATQKALAQAKAQIGGFMDVAKDTAQKMLGHMVSASEEGSLLVTFTSWNDIVKKRKREDEIRQEYQEQLDLAQKKLMDYKTAQLNSVRHVMMAGVQDAALALLGQCFAALMEEASKSKHAKATAKEVEELQSKLRTFADASAEKAMRVMATMNEGNAEAGKAMAFKSWVDYVQMEKQEKETSEALKASQAKVSEFMAKQSSGAKNTLLRMVADTDSGLLASVMQGWREAIVEEKRAAEMEAALSAKSSALTGFSTRNKGSALNASERAAQLQDMETLMYVFCIWKRETKVERMRRYGKEKNERRKKDLIGVKGLFRTFANDLESSLKQGTPRIEAARRSA